MMTLAGPETGEGRTYDYTVRLGGSPPDSADHYATEEGAWEAAEAMAQEMAEREGLDPDDVGRYDEDDADHPDTLGGVCPMGDTGAYWPVVARREVA